MVSSYFSKFYYVWCFWGNNYSNKAVIRAFCIVFSPAEIFKFPSTHLIINLVSSFADSKSKLTKIDYFSDCELLPLVWVIRMKLFIIFSMVKGVFTFFEEKKEVRVFWVAFELCATSPKSPILLNWSRTCFSDIPQPRATDFTRIYFPMNSSFF